MPTFLNSYYPICCTKKGIDAVNSGIPPFVDGSIRREPDFENEFPAITGLCRTNKLIPRLSIGDKVIYITNKINYNGVRNRYLVAVLQINFIAQNHREAADYYQKNGLVYPQNLMISETVKKSINETHQDNKSFRVNGIIDVDRWDAAYKIRSVRYPLVAICNVFNNMRYLYKPPIISDQTLSFIFNRIPGTQNPPKLSFNEEQRFFDWAITINCSI